MNLYVNCYLYRQNNRTTGHKLVEKEVFVEIFGQIVQYIFLICRLAAILKKNDRSRVRPADQMSTLLIYIKASKNSGYIKMYTGLWDRDMVG